MHQLLLGLGKDLLHWLLKYLKARNVKNQFDNQFTLVRRYPGLQHFSKPFDLIKSGTWQGIDVPGIIRTLAVNCASILVSSKDDWKTAAETASYEMGMGSVRALCEFSLLVSLQNGLDLVLKALNDTLKQFYQKKGIFRDQKMSKSAQANMDDLLVTESHQLREHKIHKICAAMETLVYGVEKVSTTKRSQLQVRLNRAQQVATAWSDADHQRAIEHMERVIHQVTPVRCKLFDELVQDHNRQLLQDVGTKETGRRSIFAKHTPVNSAAEAKAYWAANMTDDMPLQFQIRISDSEAEATTWSLADTECVTHQLESVIYGITSNEQKRFTKEFSIPLIKFEGWWEAIGIQALRKPLNSTSYISDIQRCIL